jgi:hypothetical protein
MKSTLKYQLELMNEIRAMADINIVTCGNCGAVILHRMLDFNDFDKDNTITCYSCKNEMDLSDCPDFFYEGMPEMDDEQ